MSRTSATGLSSAYGPGRPGEGFYPSPYFDIAQTYLPRSMRELYKWLEYYNTQHQIVAPLTAKLSTYAVTEVMFADQDSVTVDQYRAALQQMKARQRQIEFNLDRYTYGDAYGSVLIRFTKMYKCTECGHTAQVRSLVKKGKTLNVEGKNVRLNTCPSCDSYAVAKLSDAPKVAAPESLFIKRWSPYTITPIENEFTGETDYYYSPPARLTQRIRSGAIKQIAETPQAIIDAVLRRRRVIIKSRDIFRFSRPAPSREGATVYGSPIAAPVMKLLFLQQILLKSQEAVALEHIVPMRTMFPMRTGGEGDPVANINMSKWMDTIRGEIAKWRKDPNHIVVLPFQAGDALIGGQGRAYLLHQELRVYNDMAISGMGVPTSFHYGEAQYSGANVNLKALEVEFLGNREDLRGFLRFICQKVSAILGYPPVKPELRPFKMADDLQRMSMDLQLVSQQVMSPQTFCEKYDLNYDDEIGRTLEHISATQTHQIRQAKAQAEAQAEANKIMSQMAPPPPPGAEGQMPPGAAGQMPPQQPGQPGPQNVQGPPQQEGASPGPDQAQAPDVQGRMAQATQIAQELSQLPMPQQQAQLSQMEQQDPNMYALVSSKLAEQNTDMRPMPEQRPPRREGG